MKTLSVSWRGLFLAILWVGTGHVKKLLRLYCSKCYTITKVFSVITHNKKKLLCLNSVLPVMSLSCALSQVARAKEQMMNLENLINSHKKYWSNST